MKATFGLGGYVGGAAVKTGTAPVAAPFHLTAKAVVGVKVAAAAPRCAVCFAHGCERHK